MEENTSSSETDRSLQISGGPSTGSRCLRELNEETEDKQKNATGSPQGRGRGPKDKVSCQENTARGICTQLRALFMGRRGSGREKEVGSDDRYFTTVQGRKLGLALCPCLCASQALQAVYPADKSSQGF